MRSRRAPSLSILVLLGCLAIGATAAAQQPLPFDKVTSVTALPNGIELHSGSLVLRITALTDNVLRMRAGKNALPEDASWAVLPEARAATVPVIAESDAASVGFHTRSLHVRLDRAGGRLTVRDLAGNLLEQDATPLAFDGSGFCITRTMPGDAHYFGLGDKTGPLDRRGQSFRMWNTDSYGWQESTDPLYKSIPFYLSYRAGVSVGVLMDNTWPSSFDFGRKVADQLTYRAEGGPVDVYLLYGPSAKDVLKDYAWLTGPTPLPPLWVLGFQQSRYSYMSQLQVEQIAARLRADKIPADAIYLDIDFQQKNRPFTINTETFPDMPKMVATLHGEGFHVVAITDMHIADAPGESYAPFDSGVAGRHFVTLPDGSLFVGPVWPGPSVFPDFTAQRTRAWWGTLYTGFTQMGIDGFWNDMNEPSVFTPHLTLPDDAVHHMDEPGFAPRSATHLEVHNVYGMQNSRATFEGQLTLRPQLRPFVLTRATYAGGQRYAATWTGDNSATWNHLRLTTSMLKNLGLSGFSLAGADVGGYAGTPTPELLTKWIEIAAFQPIDRDHAEKGTGDHEVWANGPGQEDIRRRFLETRYRLLPYLYTVAEENTHTGLPLLRPIFLEFPDAAPDRHPIDIDPEAGGEFLVGPDLLVAAPPFPDKAGAYDATLPSAGWYDFWTGSPVSAPGNTVHLTPQLEELPVFVRPGTILPIAPLTQSTQEKPQGPLTLRVFPGPGCAGTLYQDDGATFAYRDGAFLRMSFTCNAAADGSVTLHIGPHQGTYPAWWQTITVELNGLAQPPVSVRVNGRDATFTPGNGFITIAVPDDGKGMEISVVKAR